MTSTQISIVLALYRIVLIIFYTITTNATLKTVAFIREQSLLALNTIDFTVC